MTATGIVIAALLAVASLAVVACRRDQRQPGARVRVSVQPQREPLPYRSDPELTALVPRVETVPGQGVGRAGSRPTKQTG